MVKGRVLGLALGLPILMLIVTSVIQYYFGLQIEYWIYIVVIFTAIALGISAFLPYNYGRMVREVAYITLFISILMLSLGIISRHAERVDVSLEKCKNEIIPSDTYNALAFTSCILSGYFPANQGNVAWATFYIFYLILPTVFIFSLVYGLMSSINISMWFGGNKYIPRVLTFIIALYAGRTMIGAFLLNYVGYGAWGLAAVFVAIFFTSALKKMVEGWFKIEQVAQKTREAIKEEFLWEKEFGKTIKPVLDMVKNLGGDEKTLNAAKGKLDSIKNTSIWHNLDSSTQATISEYIDYVKRAQDVDTFQTRLSELEELIKRLTKTKT